MSWTGRTLNSQPRPLSEGVDGGLSFRGWAWRGVGRLPPELAGLGRMKVNSKAPPITYVCRFISRSPRNAWNLVPFRYPGRRIGMGKIVCNSPLKQEPRRKCHFRRGS